MRTRSTAAWTACAGLVLGLSAVALPALAGDEGPLPQPPTTPLPAFENPLHDAKPGETLRFKVTGRGSGGEWVRYFEERILARKEGNPVQVLVETAETNETGEKIWSVDPSRSGWRPAPPAFRLPAGIQFRKDKEKEEVVYVGTPAKLAVRATRRVLDEPEIPGDTTGRRRDRKIWYSHDVPATGRVKEFPVPGLEDGERTAISWDKVLPEEECKKRAEKYRPPEEEKKEEAPKKEGDGEKPKEPEGGMDGEAPGMEGGGDAPPAMGS
jgi:hypothetical protein